MKIRKSGIYPPVSSFTDQLYFQMTLEGMDRSLAWVSCSSFPSPSSQASYLSLKTQLSAKSFQLLSIFHSTDISTARLNITVAFNSWHHPLPLPAPFPVDCPPAERNCCWTLIWASGCVREHREWSMSTGDRPVFKHQSVCLGCGWFFRFALRASRSPFPSLRASWLEQRRDLKKAFYISISSPKFLARMRNTWCL